MLPDVVTLVGRGYEDGVKRHNNEHPGTVMPSNARKCQEYQAWHVMRVCFWKEAPDTR